MKRISLLAAMLGSALALGAPALLPAQQHAGEDKHAHAGEPITYGKTIIGGYEIEVITDTQLEAGADAHLEVIFLEMKPPPQAVRAWIGTEDATQTGKALIQRDGQELHAHMPTPQPLLPDYRIWVEIENGGMKTRGSLPLSKEPPVSAHDHNDFLMAAITAEDKGYALTFSDENARPLDDELLKSIRSHPLHLLIIDPSLTDIQHSYPTESSVGSWSFDFSPKKGGDYRAFAAIHPDGKRQYSVATISVSGVASLPDNTLNTTATLEGHTFNLKWEEPLLAGIPNQLTISVVGPEGEPAELEAVLNMPAHIIALDDSMNELSQAQVSPARESPTSNLQAQILFPTPGFKRVLAHVRVEGKDMVAPFGIRVLQGKNVRHADHGHSHDDRDDSHAHDNHHH